MNSRFYPDSILPFVFEPLRKHFQIVTETEKGEGVISLTHFEKNQRVFVFTGQILSYQTLFTLQIERGCYIHDPYFMGKILHSCDPNMGCDMNTFSFTARRDIRPNEYLTMDYETTEEELFREFFCCCGSPNCRGLIRGYGASKKHFVLIPQEQEEALAVPTL